ncbi:MAG: SDR family oxidoreductase [Clostridia bacterium]|nr:SDR family oxidoreductase [Clostridia bacterium]
MELFMKKVLITGGTRGIGLECVKLFAENGYDTAVIYRSREEAAVKLNKEYGTACYKCNLSDREALERTVEEILRDFPDGFDVLVNNAGISLRKMICDTTNEDWDRMMAVSLTAPFVLTKSLSPFMIRRGQGRIINISSVWGEHGASCEVAYSAAKAGLIGLTKASAKELGPSGVLVNCVCPGVIDTEMNSELGADDRASLCDEIPLGRFGSAMEVAECVFFLAENSSSYITGQIISPNGGFCV